MADVVETSHRIAWGILHHEESHPCAQLCSRVSALLHHKPCILHGVRESNRRRAPLRKSHPHSRVECQAHTHGETSVDGFVNDFGELNRCRVFQEIMRRPRSTSLVAVLKKEEVVSMRHFGHSELSQAGMGAVCSG